MFAAEVLGIGNRVFVGGVGTVDDGHSAHLVAQRHQLGGHLQRRRMPWRDQQARLGVELAFTIEQCLHAGPGAIGEHPTDDCRHLLRWVRDFRNAHRHNHRLAPGKNCLTGLCDRRVCSPCRDSLTLAGDQQ
ncbi:hypothetical protein D3C76_1068530 [compost metagenome]